MNYFYIVMILILGPLILGSPIAGLVKSINNRAALRTQARARIKKIMDDLYSGVLPPNYEAISEARENVDQALAKVREPEAKTGVPKWAEDMPWNDWMDFDASLSREEIVASLPSGVVRHVFREDVFKSYPDDRSTQRVYMFRKKPWVDPVI